MYSRTTHRHQERQATHYLSFSEVSVASEKHTVLVQPLESHSSVGKRAAKLSGLSNHPDLEKVQRNVGNSFSRLSECYNSVLRDHSMWLGP